MNPFKYIGGVSFPQKGKKDDIELYT
jgi:hypothetical protein